MNNCASLVTFMFLWSPHGIGQTIIFSSCGFFIIIIIIITGIFKVA